MLTSIFFMMSKTGLCQEGTKCTISLETFKYGKQSQIINFCVKVHLSTFQYDFLPLWNANLKLV